MAPICVVWEGHIRIAVVAVVAKHRRRDHLTVRRLVQHAGKIGRLQHRIHVRYLLVQALAISACPITAEAAMDKGVWQITWPGWCLMASMSAKIAYGILPFPDSPPAPSAPQYGVTAVRAFLLSTGVKVTWACGCRVPAIMPFRNMVHPQRAVEYLKA